MWVIFLPFSSLLLVLWVGGFLIEDLRSEDGHGDSYVGVMK